MLQALLWIAGIAVAALLVGVVYLGWINGGQISAVAISVLLGGMATVLVSIISVLKESDDYSSFGTTIVVDEKTGIPPMPKFDVDTDMMRGSSINSDLISWINGGTVKVKIADKETELVSPPHEIEKTYDAISSLVSQAIQYKIATDILTYTRGPHPMLEVDPKNWTA